MNSDQHFAFRNMVVSQLQRAVTSEGGNIDDAITILGLSLLEVYCARNQATGMTCRASRHFVLSSVQKAHDQVWSRLKPFTELAATMVAPKAVDATEEVRLH